VGSRVDAGHLGLGDMGIDLRGGDGGVAKHFLDGTKVSSTVEEVGSEGVAECMRVDVRRKVNERGPFLEQEFDAPGRETAAAGVEEEGRIPGVGFQIREEHRPCVQQIGLECVLAGLSEDDLTLFGSFAPNAGYAAVEVYALEVERGDFGNSKAGAIREFQ